MHDDNVPACRKLNYTHIWQLPKHKQQYLQMLARNYEPCIEYKEMIQQRTKTPRSYSTCHIKKKHKIIHIVEEKSLRNLNLYVPVNI